MFGTTFFADNISGGGIDSYTVSMLHLDNSVIDSEYSPKTITNNSVTFSNSIYKFGGYSGQFDGATSYLSTPLVSDFQFPNDFTVDLWIYPTAIPLVWSYIIGTENWSVGSAGWAITLDSLGKIGFDVENNSGTILAGSISINNWYHIAAIRSGSTMTLYINGSSVGTASTAVSVGGVNDLQVGKAPAGLPYLYSGYMDEIRISKGIARWKSNFTPPNSQYTK